MILLDGCSGVLFKVYLQMSDLVVNGGEGGVEGNERWVLS